MSYFTMVCGVCHETYTTGMVGTAMVGSGHICPVKVERDRYRIALEEIARETGTPYARTAQAALDG